MKNPKTYNMSILFRRSKVFAGIFLLFLIFKGCIPEEDEVEDRKVSKIEIAPNESFLFGNEEMALDATIYDQHNENMDGIALSWSSSSENVATVSSTGLVTGLTEGEAIITASYENVVGSANITVMAEPVVSKVVVLPESANSSRGDHEPFTAQVFDQYDNELFGFEVQWESNYPCVAGIDESGISTAISMGKTNIYASVEEVTGVAMLEVEGVADGEKPDLKGEWMVCFDESEEVSFPNRFHNGQYIYLLNIDQEVKDFGTVGTITNIRTGRNVGLSGLFVFDNVDMFRLSWMESVAGDLEGFLLSWDENKNIDLFKGRFYDFVSGSFYVTVTRKLPD